MCAGFVLDTETMRSIVRRYGGREGKIHEDDFLQSFCRVLALYRKCREHAANIHKQVELVIGGRRSTYLHACGDLLTVIADTMWAYLLQIRIEV